MDRREELIELYLEILEAGPSTDQIEFWDPTLLAIELYDILMSQE